MRYRRLGVRTRRIRRRLGKSARRHPRITSIKFPGRTAIPDRGHKCINYGWQGALRYSPADESGQNYLLAGWHLNVWSDPVAAANSDIASLCPNAVRVPYFANVTDYLYSRVNACKIKIRVRPMNKERTWGLIFGRITSSLASTDPEAPIIGINSANALPFQLTTTDERRRAMLDSKQNGQWSSVELNPASPGFARGVTIKRYFKIRDLIAADLLQRYDEFDNSYRHQGVQAQPQGAPPLVSTLVNMAPKVWSNFYLIAFNLTTETGNEAPWNFANEGLFVDVRIKYYTTFFGKRIVPQGQQPFDIDGVFEGTGNSLNIGRSMTETRGPMFDIVRTLNPYNVAGSAYVPLQTTV